MRADGGGEYGNVDMFGKSTGIEASNQESNGKAESMHRTVLIRARCMLFACGYSLHFWGDAVEYAAYILNRSPSSSNSKRASLLEILTGKKPSIFDIGVFEVVVLRVYRDTG